MPPPAPPRALFSGGFIFTAQAMQEPISVSCPHYRFQEDKDAILRILFPSQYPCEGLEGLFFRRLEFERVNKKGESSMEQQRFFCAVAIRPGQQNTLASHSACFYLAKNNYRE